MKAINSKKFAILLALSISMLIGFAQTPQGFSFQAVIRNSSGLPIASQSVKVHILLTDQLGTITHYGEVHSLTTNPYGVANLTIGEGDQKVGTLAAVPWQSGNVYIKVEVDPTGAGSSYQSMGDPVKLYSVPYALFADNTKEVVSLSNATDDEPIFVVRNKKNEIVFAVYQSGVRVNIGATGIKGAKGGFAVGGLTGQGKGLPAEYMKITTDSARFYINDSIIKGAKGGFAVGGLTGQGKTGSTSKNFITVSPDSARIYIDDSNPKGAKGGFAIGGLTGQGKGKPVNFFDVSTNSSSNIFPSEKRIMWYPLKNAFLAGQVIIEKPDSVGINSFSTGYESRAKGNYSQAFGYQAIARGLYSTAIGYQAVAHKNNSFAFGYQARATNFDSYAFGSGAEASGNKSFAFGSVGIDSTGLTTGVPTGNTKATGDYAFAFGQGSIASGKASIAFGANNTSSGSFSTAMGYKTISSNWYSTAMGGLTTASGLYSIAMGLKSTASGVASCAIGNQSTASGVYSFACGDGAKAIGARSIALGAYSSAQGAYSFAAGYSSVTGPTATAATALGRETNASGTYSTALGYQSASSGIYSLAGGNVSTASGISSIALGDHASASANYSIALGKNVTASTQYAIAIGNTTTASGDNSTAFGNQTTAVGKYSLAVGYGCTANAYSSTAVGSYNVIEGTPGSWIASDPIFAVGNGTSSSSLSNAVTVYKDGTMKLKSNFYPELPAATLGTSGNKWNTVFATNGTINTSDLRLKDNITELTYGLAELLKLKPISFLWKKSPQEGRKLGFIAQDVKPIINEVVVEGDDPDKTLGINYSSIIPVIVKGMQEQQQQIAKQKEQIDELIAANKILLERIGKLEGLNKK